LNGWTAGGEKGDSIRCPETRVGVSNPVSKRSLVEPRAGKKIYRKFSPRKEFHSFGKLKKCKKREKQKKKEKKTIKGKTMFPRGLSEGEGGPGGRLV